MSEPPFRVLETSRPFQGGLLAVRTDRIADADGRTAIREVVEHPGAVAALVVDDEGQLLLVDQWRHPVGARVLEVAAGKYDADGELVEETLRRELAEELEVEGGTLTWLSTFYSTPGWSDEVVDLYLAEGVRPIAGGAPARDWEEAGLEEHLETVADPDDGAAGLGEPPHLVHDRREPRDPRLTWSASRARRLSSC